MIVLMKIREVVAAHPKTAGLLATAAIAGAAYYGVPPEITQTVLQVVFGG
jgi:hypothetical protein